MSDKSGLKVTINNPSSKVTGLHNCSKGVYTNDFNQIIIVGVDKPTVVQGDNDYWVQCFEIPKGGCPTGPSWKEAELERVKSITLSSEV